MWPNQDRNSGELWERHDGKVPGCVAHKGFVESVRLRDAQEPGERHPVCTESALLLDLRRPGKKMWHREESFTRLDESKGKEERYHWWARGLCLSNGPHTVVSANVSHKLNDRWRGEVLAKREARCVLNTPLSLKSGELGTLSGTYRLTPTCIYSLTSEEKITIFFRVHFLTVTL